VRLIAALLLVLGTIGATPPPAAGAAPFDPGPAIRSAVDAHFGHWDAARHASFERAWARYEAEAGMRAGDRDATDLAATRLLASLHNGHSWFYDNAFFETRPSTAPFELQYAEGAWIATQSRTPRVSNGARLLSVDGVPAETYFREHEDLSSVSSEREGRGNDMLRRICLGVRANGAAHLQFSDKQSFVLDNASSRASEIAPRVRSRWLVVRKIAYVAIPSFDDPAFERAANQTIRNVWSAQSIVIDVRGNGGGTTPAWLLWLLADRPLPWWRETTTAPQPARALGNRGQHVPRNPQAYRGRVVLISDERCGSSCEDFVMPLAVSGRARFVGARTKGTTGMIFTAQLDKSAWLAVGTIHESFPNGAQFEGVGIEPTDPVPLRVADVRANRDAALERALAIAEGAR
jgi:carboxyl-terminal processing protease